MRISRHLLGELSRERERHAPRECCGLLVGREERVERRIPITNRALTPNTSYRLDPREHLKAELECRRRGQSVLAIYHSHPEATAWPSTSDDLEAHCGYLYLIIGDDGVRAFRREGHRLVAQPLEEV